MNDTSKRTQIEFIDIFPSSIFLSYHSKRIEDSQNLQIKIGNEFFDLSSLIVLNKEISVNAAAPLTISKKGSGNCERKI